MCNGDQAKALRDNPAVIAHINMLQGIISRLATASGSCKTWCLTLVAALLSLAGATRTPAIITVALVPIVVFGFLDTMYLSQERAYRDLFERIVAGIRNDSYPSCDLFKAKAPMSFANVRGAFCSWAVLPVYPVLLVTYLVAHCMGWLALIATPAG